MPSPLDLADPLPGDPKALSDLLQRSLMPVDQPKAQLQHPASAVMALDQYRYLDRKQLQDLFFQDAVNKGCTT